MRVTHIPSGIIVTCQDEKSQHKNKAKALKILRARLLERLQAEQHAAEAASRRTMVGSGDRSERIRTYNFPQGRVTDHRINFTVYSLPAFMEGDIQSMTEALLVAEGQENVKAGLRVTPVVREQAPPASGGGR